VDVAALTLPLGRDDAGRVGTDHDAWDADRAGIGSTSGREPSGGGFTLSRDVSHVLWAGSLLWSVMDD